MDMLRRFIEDAPIGAAMFDRDMRYVAYSPRWLADHRLDGLELGASHYDVVPDMPGRWREVHRRCLAGETICEAEDRFERADGSVVWLRWEVRPWRDAEGAIGGVIIFTEDITPQKNAEDALAGALARLRLAQSAGRIGVWNWDLATNAAYLNDEWYDLHGLPKGAEISYEDYLARVHPDDRQAADANMRAAIAGDGDISFDCRIVRADNGEIRWVTSKGEVSFGPDGRALRAMGAVYDITERKELERALREADQRKSEFLAILAHELRNPLTPIKNAISVLLRLPDGGPETAQKKTNVLKMAERQIDHLLRLVDELLDVTRISYGKIKLQRQRADLVELLGHAAELARPGVEAKRLDLSLDLPPALPIVGDPVRLTQVFANLLSNAARYTQDGGWINVTAREDGGDAVVTVRDNGAGVEPDMLASIFELFAQAGPASGQGLGVGLALARNLVELHGGEISAHSEGSGRGSAFTVKLPLP